MRTWQDAKFSFEFYSCCCFFHLKYLSKSHNSELSRLKEQVVLVQVQSSKKHLTAT